MDWSGWNNAPTNEWAFGGGLRDDNEHGGINIDQQENKKMAPISPSQKLDGEVSPEKRRGGTAPGPSNMVASRRDATTPGAPSASSVTASGAVLSWAGAADDVGVAGYRVTVGGKTMRTLATTLAVSGLSAGTLHPVSVQAYDAKGNRSAASTGTLTTLAAP